MRIRNCPNCYGTGTTRLGHRNPKCGMCHGKKKINAEFVKWINSKTKAENELTDYWEEQMRIQAESEISEAIKSWEKRHPKPRKFPKVRILSPRIGD